MQKIFQNTKDRVVRIENGDNHGDLGICQLRQVPTRLNFGWIARFFERLIYEPLRPLTR